MIYIVVLIFVLVVFVLLVGRSTEDLSPFEGKVPMVDATYFKCQEHNYKRLVSFYDSDDPPTCPICGKNLTKGGR